MRLLASLPLPPYSSEMEPGVVCVCGGVGLGKRQREQTSSSAVPERPRWLRLQLHLNNSEESMCLSP